MTKDEVSKHDEYFKSILGMKDMAISLVRGTFSKELVKRLDFNSFKLDNNSYVDKSLTKSFSDIVYNCKLNSDNQKTNNDRCKCSCLLECFRDGIF